MNPVQLTLYLLGQLVNQSTSIKHLILTGLLPLQTALLPRVVGPSLSGYLTLRCGRLFSHLLKREVRQGQLSEHPCGHRGDRDRSVPLCWEAKEAAVSENWHQFSDSTSCNKTEASAAFLSLSQARLVVPWCTVTGSNADPGNCRNPPTDWQCLVGRIPGFVSVEVFAAGSRFSHCSFCCSCVLRRAQKAREKHGHARQL
ncbi:uncharacterized protein LOC110201160 isoform X3 [Phascolarctos cinereus]